MSNSIDDRVLALAGLVQALAQVRRIADTGQSETRQVEAALDSVFLIDAASAEAADRFLASRQLQHHAPAHAHGAVGTDIGIFFDGSGL